MSGVSRRPRVQGLAVTRVRGVRCTGWVEGSTLGHTVLSYLRAEISELKLGVFWNHQYS